MRRANSKIVMIPLTDPEIKAINQEIIYCRDLTYVSPNMWNSFQETYAIYLGDAFAGVCAAALLEGWVKIGPIIILRKYRRKGYGSKLIAHIIEKHKDKNIYVGSSNPAFGPIAMKFGFRKTNNYFSLPGEIRSYLIKTLLRFLNPMFFIEGARKALIYGKMPYTYYLKEKKIKK